MTTINQSTDCLVIVDVQNDFCEGGALEVPGANEIIPLINKLGAHFKQCVASQDWHPCNHSSFASRYRDKSPFQTIELEYGTQVLWPDHCVQHTHGAAFHEHLDMGCIQTIIRKGFRKNIDSYSTFFENDHRTSTGLTGYLQDRGLSRLFFCGLATDFCVAWSALDAVAQGFEVFLLEEACRAIDLDGSLQQAREDMARAGVQTIESGEFLQGF